MEQKFDYRLAAEFLEYRRLRIDVERFYNIKERTARDIIAKISHELPIISYSSKSGYKLAKTSEDIGEAVIAKNELRSRIRELEKRLKQLDDFLYKMGMDDIKNNPSKLKKEVV